MIIILHKQINANFLFIRFYPKAFKKLDFGMILGIYTENYLDKLKDIQFRASKTEFTETALKSLFLGEIKGIC